MTARVSTELLRDDSKSNEDSEDINGNDGSKDQMTLNVVHDSMEPDRLCDCCSAHEE